MSDNFHFDLTGVSLDKCFDIAFGPHRKATHWATQPATTKDEREARKTWDPPAHGQRIILFWSPPDIAMLKAQNLEGHVLPGPLDAESAVHFVKSWLSSVDYGPQPDHDGDNSKGWRVYNESWGHVAGMWQAFVAIEPVWLMHGK